MAHCKHFSNTTFCPRCELRYYDMRETPLTKLRVRIANFLIKRSPWIAAKFFFGFRGTL